MMFDPPDFPYRELSETLREHYSADDLFNNDISTNDNVIRLEEVLSDVTENVKNAENQLSVHSNNLGRFFVESTGFGETVSENIEKNTELYVVQPDIFHMESTLLDDNIVNQFLLPLQVSSEKEKVFIFFTYCYFIWAK